MSSRHPWSPKSLPSMDQREGQSDRHVSSAARSQVGVNRPHFYRIGNARRIILLRSPDCFFARCGSMVAIWCHFPKKPCIHAGCSGIRNEQVVGSNPTSGSILLGFLRGVWLIWSIWNLRCANGGSKFRSCHVLHNSNRLRRQPVGWFPFLPQWPQIGSDIGNFLRLSVRPRDTPQNFAARTMPVIGRG